METAKDTNYIKKFFKQKLLRIQFSTKNSLHTSLSLPEVELESSTDLPLEFLQKFNET